MLTNFSLKMPKLVFSGVNALDNISFLIQDGNYRKIAFFTDKVIMQTPIFDDVKSYIDKTGVLTEVFSDLPAEPSYQQVQQLVDSCTLFSPDFIIALGGGSVMDSAKLASVLLCNDYTVKDLLSNPNLAVKKVRTLMIPTTAGTGAEATPNAIVAVPEDSLKVGIVNSELIPDYVILSASTIKNLPRHIAAATGIDALCHAIECFTSNKANSFSDTFALAALELIMANIEKACDDADALESKEKMLLASFYAGVAITSSGTTAVHALSYPLGGRYHIPHGVSNAILLIPVLHFNEDKIRSRLAIAYNKCGYSGVASEEEKSKDFIGKISRIIQHLDIPSDLKKYGVSINDLEDLVNAGMKVTRLLNNNMKIVTKEDARKIYQEIL